MLSSLHVGVPRSRSWVYDVHRELNEDLLVEHVHAKLDPHLSCRQHCTHIHHRCLIQHGAKVHRLGIHGLRDVSSRRGT